MPTWVEEADDRRIHRPGEEALVHRQLVAAEEELEACPWEELQKGLDRLQEGPLQRRR